jgi:crossover junction endodeoxyribonuclease RuvC
VGVAVVTAVGYPRASRDVNDSDIVLGIDPGTHRCGYGAVARRGNRFLHIGHGVARAPATAPLPERLAAIADELERAIRELAPSSVAIEQAFFHRDVHAALVLGHARGVAMLIAARARLPVAEYAPATVKRTVVGSGKADKDQVNGMIRAILGLTEAPPLDASDALAVAICHASAKDVHAQLATVAAARRVRRR